MSAENKNPEFQQFERADEIINLGTLAYETKKQQKAMLEAQVRQDAAQKFANDTLKIIKEVGDQYKNYLSRNGEHPDNINAVGDSRISMYRNPIVTLNSSVGDLYYNEMYDIYVAESQKACVNTGKMLKQLGFKVTDAYTRQLYDIDTTERQDPKYHHGCIFKFAAEELNKKKK